MNAKCELCEKRETKIGFRTEKGDIMYVCRQCFKKIQTKLHPDVVQAIHDKNLKK